MRKILLALIAFASFASADYLLNSSYICLKSYYVTPSTGTLYYVRSDTGATLSTTTKSLIDDIIDGYEYNATTNQCKKVGANNSIGLENNDYTYFMGLTGLITGTLLVTAIFLGLRVS